MLNLTVIAVGRLNAAYYKQAAAEYEKRLSAFCKVHVIEPVSYTHLDVYKRQGGPTGPASVQAFAPLPRDMAALAAPLAPGGALPGQLGAPQAFARVRHGLR